MNSIRIMGGAIERGLIVCLALAAPHGRCAEYWLQTGTTTNAGVPMWGYALCGSGSAAPAGCAGTVTVPGPPLTVPPGEGLIVHLVNTLPEPTSLVISGQIKPEPMLPVWFEPAAPATIYHGARPDANTTARVRSFDREADAGGGTATYTWTTLKPGTYLYSSGTHPQVQVQMGLYGAVTKDAGTGSVAYQQGLTNVTYANQATLVYSEIDPALHAAVSAGTFGSSGATSTLDYRPKFFLINGVPFPGAGLNPLAIPSLPAGQFEVPPGQALLLRLLNAGLKTHVPTIIGEYWQVVAEDGNPVPFLANPRQQFSAFLPAGKTLDLIVKPSNNSASPLRYAVFDSRFFDMTNGIANGGMVFKIAVSPGIISAPVFDSVAPLTATAGVPYVYAAHASSAAGHPIGYALVGPPPPPTGMTVGAATGQVTWPSPVAGSFPITLRATDQTVPTLSATQQFTLVVGTGGANRAPLATADSYTAVSHGAAAGPQSVTAPGVLANDSDPDGNPITAVKVSECTVTSNGCNSSNRVTLAATGALTLASSTSSNSVRVTYRAVDNSGAPNNTSANAIVTIAMQANRAPLISADAFTVPRCTTRLNNGVNCRTGTGFYQPATLNLVDNDSDPDFATMDAAHQAPLAVARVRSQSTGTNNGNLSSITTANGATVTIAGGTVTYVPRWNVVGTDTFQYRVQDGLGKESGSTTSNANNFGAGWATVTITVQ